MEHKTLMHQHTGGILQLYLHDNTNRTFRQIDNITTSIAVCLAVYRPRYPVNEGVSSVVAVEIDGSKGCGTIDYRQSCCNTLHGDGKTAACRRFLRRIEQIGGRHFLV